MYLERETIAAYFSKHTIEVEPLPPGIAKRLERGKGTEEPVHINSWPQDEGWLVLRVALECEKCPFTVSMKLEP